VSAGFIAIPIPPLPSIKLRQDGESMKNCTRAH
jgi:hypothetical protein